MYHLKQSSESSQKTPLRLLTLLLATMFIVCGYLLYCVKSIGATAAAATAATSPDTLKGLKLSEDVRIRMPTLYALDSTDDALLKKSSQSLPLMKTERSKTEIALMRSLARQLRLGGVAFVPLPKLAEDGYGSEPASEDQKKAGRVWLGIKIFCLDGKYIGRVRLEIERPLPEQAFTTLWSTESHQEFVATSERDVSVKTEEAIHQVVNAFIYEYRQSNDLPNLPEQPEQRHWADSSRYRYARSY